VRGYKVLAETYDDADRFIDTGRRSAAENAARILDERRARGFVR